MPELRKDPILGRWVIISTERGMRPSAFRSIEEEEEKSGPCPFCEGNEKLTPPEIYALRKEGTKPDTPGWMVRVVPNKYPALGIEQKLVKQGVGMYDMMTGYGAHEVIIETPDHKKTVKDQSIEEIADVIRVFQHRVEDLHNDTKMRYILIFKNQGLQAGASIAHPHAQLIATPITPKAVKEELLGAEEYFKLKERCVYCDIMKDEMIVRDRIIYENDAFISFCPYASRFPFEIWLLPKEHGIDFFSESVKAKARLLADQLKVTMQKLALALNNPQYNYLIHAAPNRFPRRGYWKTIDEDFHWHIEIMPKLTRIAGFEWGTGFYINPTSPEEAAELLRSAKV